MIYLQQSLAAISLLALQSGAIADLQAAMTLESPKMTTPIKTSICELLKSPNKYSGKFVEITGIYSYNFEISTISDSDCNKNESIWIDISEKYDECNCNDQLKRLPQLTPETATSGKSFRVTITGRFEKAKKQLIGKHKSILMRSGFGHLNLFPYRIEIDCFLKVSPLGSNQ